jgi:hypothetical protein
MYKLMHEDDASFVIQGKDGKHFKVAKQALPEEFHKKVRKLKPVKMADGGIVPDQPEVPEALAGTSTPNLDVTGGSGDVMRLTKSFDPEKASADLLQARMKKLDALTPPNDYHALLYPGGREEYLKNASIDQLYTEKQASDAGNAKRAELAQLQAKMDQDNKNQMVMKAGALGLPQSLIDNAPQAIPITAATPSDVMQSPGPEGQPSIPQQQMPQASQGLGGIPTNMLGLLKEEQAGIQGLTKAQMDSAKAQEKIYADLQQQREDSEKRQKANFDEFQTSQAQLAQDYMSSKIDPHRIWNNMGTGNKIGAAIAVALSAIGSGLQGGKPNLALEQINGAISRDIDAQKADLGKKQNLMTLNMQKYRNVQDAEIATQAQMIGIAQAKIQQVAAKAQSAETLAKAHFMNAQLGQQAMQLGMQLSERQAQAQQLGALGGEGGIPVGQEPLHMLSDKEYQKKRIVVGGKAFQAPSDEDAKDLRNLQSEYEPVRQMVNQLSQLQGNPKTLITGTPENLKAQSIRAFLVPRMNKMHGLSRLSEEDIKIMKDQLADPSGFTDFLNGKAKNVQFIKNLNEDLDENYKTRLIGYKGAYQPKSFKPVGSQ